MKPWILCIRLAIFWGAMLAGVGRAETTDEIQHLLDYVSGSGCTFVRNGVESDATAARKHLATKYEYAKGRIASAEDFIRSLASRSSMTGQPYVVRCGASQLLSEDWLTNELRRYRQER